MVMNKHSGFYIKTSFVRLKRLQRSHKGILCLMLLMSLSTSSWIFAQDQSVNSANGVADHARASWMEGAPIRALDILEQGIRDNPESLTLQKLRGHVLSTSRRPQEAVEVYESVLQRAPDALDVRWAKWSVLLRTGQDDQAIAELQRIAQQDATNPLVYMRLAQELRKRDRLEESLVAYQKAVELVSELPGWRLALARARFDVLDAEGARDEIQEVLKTLPPDSPEAAVAQNLMLEFYGTTKERGRRYEYVFSPGATAAERKEWAFVRTEAWKSFEAHRYEEAEGLYRRAVALNPNDSRAHLELGVTLMELDQCQEAVPILQKVLSMKGSDEMYADTFFRVGQCLAKLERWPEALYHFEILYAAAVEFEEGTKGVPVKGGITILSKEKLAKWVEKARQNIPEDELQKLDAMKNIQTVDPSSVPAMTEEELYKKLAAERINPQKPLSARTALMGRDSDYSWFRFVIPSGEVMRDDLPGGAHEFMPIDPVDTFPATQEEIYLVFGLVSSSFQDVPLTAKCFLESSKITEHQNALAEDQVIMTMNDRTGYFVIYPPEAGWPSGLHWCGLFVGDQVNAYTHADEVRFRIIESTSSS